MTRQNPTPKYVPDFIHNYKPSKDVIVIGQSPSASDYPSASGTFAIINAWMTTAGVYAWSFMNASEEIGGNKMSQVDLKKFREDIDPWIGKKIIAMGELASRVLTKLNIPHLKIQHPSGLNRNLNNPDIKLIQPTLIYNYVKGKK